MTTVIQEYKPFEAALADLEARYKGVLFDVSTKEGLATAIKGRAEIRTYRVNLEKVRVVKKERALKECQDIDSDARNLKKQFESLENPIDDQIKAKERAEQAVKDAAIKAEVDRIDAEELARKQAEEEKIAAERAEIARQRAELEKAAQERVEAERQVRLKIEQEQREARMKIEEEQRKARAERDEADRKAAAARAAEEAKARAEREETDRQFKAALAKEAARVQVIRDAEEADLKAAREKIEAARRVEENRARAEREKIEAEKRAAEEAERKAREAQEEQARQEREAKAAIERERLRLEAELSDGYEMLATFVRRFGKRKEFAAVVKAIGPYLRAPAKESV